ncbi:MAG: hypothetical protein JWL70_2303 [Acidimicrobiia bacterium]|nr:hypothetical protein [Acidimicrobiia bacterium]
MRVDSPRTTTSNGSRFVFTSEAITPAGAAPDLSNPLSCLTADDRALIKAASGIDVTSSMVRGGAAHPVDPFIAIVANHRSTGQLRGKITRPYLTGLFAQYADRPDELNPEYLTGAIDYLTAHGRENRVDLTL